ncbi:MAG TPA: MarR family transcriptional regulator [Vicinamibacterales bacterium]|nr:MarR family transcriptional regulator [Vicinamibacterales bacterium]
MMQAANRPAGSSPQARRAAAAGRGVADRLHSAAIHLLRRLRRHDEAMGLTPARASALSLIVFGGPVTLGTLARAEQVSAPTITRLIVGMERDGLVRRDSDATDGRVVWLQATAKGTRLLHEGRQRRVAALAEDLETLSADDRATVAAAAEILERMLAGAAGGGTADRKRVAASGSGPDRRAPPSSLRGAAARRKIRTAAGRKEEA